MQRFRTPATVFALSAFMALAAAPVAAQAAPETASTVTAEQEGGRTPNINPGAVAGVALPDDVVIEGDTWHLNQDGYTYVRDQSRTDTQPSAEERAASEKLLEDYSAEVIAQSQASQAATASPDVLPQEVDTTAPESAAAPAPVAEPQPAPPAATADESHAPTVERGIAASTGNNTVPRTLAGLALLSVLAAATLRIRRSDHSFS